MDTSEINELANLLKSYAKYSHLECDGLSRVFHRVLSDERIAHTVFAGVVTHVAEDRTTPAHTCIDLDNGLRIDYRLQRWLGASFGIPHGIFDPKKFMAVRYEGNIVKLPILSWAVIEQLLTPISVPEGWRAAPSGSASLSQMTKKQINLPEIALSRQEILGKPLNEARAIAEKRGYRLEVLIPDIEIDAWGEEHETGYAIAPSNYDPHKLNVSLDESGNVASYDY